MFFFNGHLQVFSHAGSDLASFRLFTSQLIVAGSATQGHVAKAFGVPLVTIKRATEVYRERQLTISEHQQTIDGYQGWLALSAEPTEELVSHCS